MNDVIVVENRVDEQCMRVIHLMSNNELCADAVKRYDAPVGAQAEVKQEAGVWHLRAAWPYRGILDIQPEGWPKFRRLIVWSLDGCVSVREAISQAIVAFWLVFKFRPGFVFMRKLPSGVENAAPLSLSATSPHLEEHKMGGGDELILLEADWMLERCVAVGGRM